jgi:NAD(P)H-dependent FMN reductase
MRLLGISGSLRARSSNAELLRALALVARPGSELVMYRDLAHLPHFNPDLDAEGMVVSPAVQELRRAVGEADGLVISSPEYAHGVPGSLKNALDWLVSGPEMIHKPVSLLNPSPRSIHAHASLAETLRTMSAVLVDGACIAVPVSGRGLDAEQLVADGDLGSRLRAVVRAMEEAAPEYQERRVAP